MEKYSEYKDSGVEWLGEIPSHWELRKMKFSFIEKSKKGFPNLPLLAATQNHGVILKEQYESRTVEATKSLETLKLVDVGDFVISLRSFQGGIELSHDKGIISPAYTILTPTHISVDYFKHLGKSSIFISLLQSMVTGIREGQNIDYGKLRENSLPIPPLSEQKSIAAYLDSQTSKIDEAIAQQQKMIDLLNERKQIIINNAVTKGLDSNVPMKDSGVDWIGMIPEHWKINRFKNLFSTKTGITFTKAQLVDEGASVISYGQIHSKSNLGASLNPQLIRYIPSSLIKGKDGCVVKKGDFLFADTSEDFEGCGNSLYNNTELLIYAGYHTILARNNNSQYGQYLAYLFASSKWRGQLRSKVNGVKVYSITQTLLNSVMVILPPKQEQKHIADYIEEKVRIIDKSVEQFSKRINLLQERKQIIINEVVTGKVKVS